MAKPGKMKKKCEKYRNSGRRSENKLKRQQRHERKLAKFAAKRENNKSKATPKPRKPIDPDNRGTNLMEKEPYTTQVMVNENKLPLSRWTSCMRRLKNVMDKEAAIIKASIDSTNRPHNNKKARKALTQDEEE